MLKVKIFFLLVTAILFSGSIPAQTPETPAKKELPEEIVTKIYTDVNEKYRWKIDVEYPELKLPKNKSADRFNKIAQKMVMNFVDDFKKRMSGQTEEDLKMLPEGVSLSLDTGYSVEFFNEDIISINFLRTEYGGGVHPNSWAFTLNYDLKKNRKIKLKDLFKKNSAFLKIISRESIKQIMKKRGENADKDWVTSGAGEKPENFQSWNITKKGLLFTFDPYIVGPYSDGFFETTVAYKEFPSDMRGSFFYRIAKIR